MSGRPLRVLRVIARMNVGGPALQVVALTRGLDPSRFEQRLLVGSVGPDEGDYLDLRAPDVPAVRVTGLGRSVNATGDVRAMATLVREMRAFRPDIVHTHTAKAGVLGRTAARLVGVPIVVHTFHGHLLHGYFSPRVTTAVTLTERALAKTTTRLVAVGSRVRDELLAAGIGRPDQYDVVPPGVVIPETPDRAAARAALGLPATGPVVVFVARLTAVKRPDRFVDVAHAVLARHPDATFAVAGEGDLLEDLKRRAAELGDGIRFLGWQSDVTTVYAASDVVLLTSDNEGMPVSLIEAAATGRPAVTTDAGSAREVVLDGRTGFVTPMEVAPLADAVSRLLQDDDLRATMGAAAAAHARDAFSERRLVDDVARIYEALADKKRDRLARRSGWTNT